MILCPKILKKMSQQTWTGSTVRFNRNFNQTRPIRNEDGFSSFLLSLFRFSFFLSLLFSLSFFLLSLNYELNLTLEISSGDFIAVSLIVENGVAIRLRNEKKKMETQFNYSLFDRRPILKSKTPVVKWVKEWYSLFL